MQPEKDQRIMEQFRCPTGVQGRKLADYMNEHHSALTDWGLEKVKIKPNFTILDIGCGGGKTLTKLAKFAFQGQVYGMDCSKDMVEYSREINRDLITQNRVSIVEGCVDKTSFPNEFFNLVTAIETYYFWPSLKDAFQEIYRILKPQAQMLMINEMVKNGTYEKENAELIKKTHTNIKSFPEIKDTLTTAGYKKIQIFQKTGSLWNAILAQKPK
jgi:ubiquinone/menaquinone biosynthesis C-methylase UbiE